jgi:hypothetical protein
MTNVKARRKVEVRKCAVQFDDASQLFASSFVYSFVIRHSDFVIPSHSSFACRAVAPRRRELYHFSLLVVWTSQEGMIIVTR